MPSKNLPKYDHLTGEDSGYEPSEFEQARSDYSLLSKFLGLKRRGEKRRALEDTEKY